MPLKLRHNIQKRALADLVDVGQIFADVVQLLAHSNLNPIGYVTINAKHCTRVCCTRAIVDQHPCFAKNAPFMQNEPIRA